MRIRAPVAVLCCLLAGLWVPPATHEATPPNRKDPCARKARNVCGTTGAGFYKVGRYGQRWYGSFRGAIAGAADAYCIDLRFWYPSKAYAYREVRGGALTNRAGKAVSLESQQRIAYALWRFGRTKNADRAAAVMLYVHSQMGDARPGELDPKAVNRKVASFYRTVAHDSALYHGPYRVEIRVGGALTVGTRATATVRVVSARGKPMSGVALAITGDGVGAAAARTARTNASGAVAVAFAPSSGSPRLTARASGLPSTLPRLFAPTTAKARPNGQRLVVPSSQQVSATLRSAASRRQVGITTSATPTTLAVGEPSADRVTLTGAAAGWKATVAVRIYGPFASLAQATCDGQSAWSGSFVTDGPGTYTTPAARLALAGWYTYVVAVPSDAVHTGLTTACGTPAESFKVQSIPKLTTTVSNQRVTTGTPITDRIHVDGLAGASVAIRAALYGPFAGSDKIACNGTPAWSGTILAGTDGDYVTPPYTPTLPGYYTYREQIDPGELVRGTQTACGETAETTLAFVRPHITTEISRQQALVGSTITDRLTVTGIGGLAVTVRVELWGPFASLSAVRCSGTPYKVQTLAVPGDGTFTTPGVQVAKAGVYTYVARVAAGTLNEAFAGACGEATETVVVTTPVPPPPPTTTTTPAPPPPPVTTPAPPATKVTKQTDNTTATLTPVAMSVTTVSSHEVARPGSAIFDRIRTRGVRGPVQVQLFGPFKTRSAIRCTGKAAWTGRVTIRKDGTIRSPSVRLRKAGLYGFRERVLAPGGKARLVTPCAIRAETTVVAPLVLTGKGDFARYVPAPGAGSATPVRIRIAARGISARVFSVGIDTKAGALGVPRDIARSGWWRDGALPGDAAGSTVIAAHVDSATRGAGAFFRLGRAAKGDRVEVTTAGGRKVRYRVVSVKRYAKTALPVSIWSRRGRARLVLVTCGGPFNAAAGHYRDNVVVTAVPL